MRVGSLLLGVGACVLPFACAASGGSTSRPSAPELARYPLVVTLSSIGQGTDPDAPGQLERVVSDFETQNAVFLAVKVADWGKEGEDDYCYSLAEVSPEKARSLIHAVRAAFAGNELVQVRENVACRESKNSR
ncbi:MAG: hypothetical protein IPI67_36385 [Myxococcales bacterium]|nr:hypothetical protein [Myxococcales bacterium]